MFDGKQPVFGAFAGGSDEGSASFCELESEERRPMDFKRCEPILIITSIVAAAVLAGCNSSPTTSTVSGTLKQETFPSPVQNVSIVSDKGTSTVPVDAAGRFKLV